MARRRALEGRMRDVLATFAFGEVQTPTFEEFELFERKAGAAIAEEIYEFRDKADRRLCLRPELTLPVMRFYFASELKMAPKPLRLFYFGPCYRYDKPQEGRYREFWQLGTEVVGDPSPEGHAELLWLALSLLRGVGLQGIQLRVGHLSLLRGLIENRLGLPLTEQEAIMRFVDKKDFDGLRRALDGRAKPADVDAFLRVFDVATFDELRPLVTGDAMRAGLVHLERVFEVLRGFGADPATLRVDPTIARGLEYYSGLVFELDCPILGTQKQILGGGEYDLSGVFGQQPVPTVGFGLGFDRTLVALGKAGAAGEGSPRPDGVVIALTAAAVPLAQRVGNELRDAGLRIEVDLSGRGAGKSLKHAAAVKARHAVLIGDREVESNRVAIKDLENGEQTDSSIAEAVLRMGGRLPGADT